MPIVAITAHAMSEDRDRCLAAGMDAYYPKPVRTSSLLHAVAEALDVDASDELPGAPVDSARWSLAAARDAILVRFEGREDILAELVDLLKSELPAVCCELRDAVAKRHFSDAAVLSHRLKGMLGNIAAEEAVLLADELEDACQRTHSSDADRLTRDLSDALVAIVGEMNSSSALLATTL